MRAQDVRELYQRTGIAPPADIAAPNAEHIRNTRRKVVGGYEFRSTLEATAFQVLSSWVQAGRITNLILQPWFLLQPKYRRDGKTERAITYRADFSYTTADGIPFVIEVKGFRTEVFNIKRKLFLTRFPEVEYQIWTRATIKDLL